MVAPATYLLGNWPVIVAIASGLGLLIAAVRYKIPDLARRLESVESAKHPSESDLNMAVGNFQTVCKFNQVSCQKATACQINKVNDDMKEKLADLYELIHAQAIIIARVDERVAAMHRNQKLTCVPQLPEKTG